MSDSDSMTEIVVEEATDQLDAEGLIGGDSLQEQVDSAEVGRAVGARLGEAAGQRIGAAVGRRVQETLGDIDDETGPRALGRDLADAVRDGFGDALSESRDRGSALSSVADAVQDTDLGSQVADAIGGEGESSADGDSETDAADGGSATETDDSSVLADVPAPADAVDEMDAEELDVDDLESFQTETLEEYLRTIPYRDLQSIAKEVGVTANITQEEMTERIVDAVTDDADDS